MVLTTGAVGAQGAKGDKGDPGRDAAVTCKVKDKKNVVCTVAFVGTKASKSTEKTTVSKVKASTARLTRNGRTYAKGSVGHLKSVRKLVKGGYNLRVGSGKSTTLYKITIK
ncbi:MAG TPA: hypothetical protein VI318_15655 [Baekduia sp.]